MVTIANPFCSCAMSIRVQLSLNHKRAKVFLAASHLHVHGIAYGLYALELSNFITAFPQSWLLFSDSSFSLSIVSWLCLRLSFHLILILLQFFTKLEELKSLEWILNV